jgi:hypothetical protein
MSKIKRQFFSSNSKVVSCFSYFGDLNLPFKFVLFLAQFVVAAARIQFPQLDPRVAALHQVGGGSDQVVTTALSQLEREIGKLKRNIFRITEYVCCFQSHKKDKELLGRTNRRQIRQSN